MKHYTRKRCPKCNGSGQTDCPHCNGTGYDFGDGGQCEYCYGEGTAECDYCNGTGEIEELDYEDDN